MQRIEDKLALEHDLNDFPGERKRETVSQTDLIIMTTKTIAAISNLAI